MRPTDTTRTFTIPELAPANAPLAARPSNRCLGMSSCATEPIPFTSGSPTRQVEGIVSPNSKPFRLALIQTAVASTDEFLRQLLQRGIVPFVATPEQILKELNMAAATWNIIAYPISAGWQRALDFAREVRRIRERHGALPYPWTLVISFNQEPAAAIEWFRRVVGTRYITFSSGEDLVSVLHHIHREILEIQRASQRLTLRLVHGGNRDGIGCIRGESLEAIYASFLPGQEDEIGESESVLRFLNLLAMNRWRSRTPSQLIRLMQNNPFYTPEGAEANLIGKSSVKTYIHRCETALSQIWSERCQSIDPPAVIGRESRGGKEVSYRLLASCEIDHV
jgi:hypothetical protein